MCIWSNNMGVSNRKIHNELESVEAGVLHILSGNHHPLTQKYIKLYLHLQEKYIRDLGEPIELISFYEPELTDRFFDEYDDKNKTIKQISVEVLSNTIFLQSLPNANHRTSIAFVTIFLENNEVFIKEYLKNKHIIDTYIHKSNGVIQDYVKELERPKYFNNEENELKAWREFLEKHIIMTEGYFDNFIQSGAPDAMPLKRLRAAFSVSENP